MGRIVWILHVLYRQGKLALRNVWHGMAWHCRPSTDSAMRSREMWRSLLAKDKVHTLDPLNGRASERYKFMEAFLQIKLAATGLLALVTGLVHSVL
jgi:hypothetical protein